MKEYKIFLIAIAITFFISLASIVVFMGDKNTTTNIPMPWQSYVQNDTVYVLGLPLERATIRDMMTILGKEAEVSLFKDKKHKTRHLEVYFDSAKIGGLSVRVVANIMHNDTTLQFLNENISNHEVLPSGNEKVEFNNFANNQLLDLIVQNITIVPKTNLDTEVLLQRFGEPDSKTENAWFYPRKGLKIIMDEGLKILEYSNNYTKSY